MLQKYLPHTAYDLPVLVKKCASGDMSDLDAVILKLQKNMSSIDLQQMFLVVIQRGSVEQVQQLIPFVRLTNKYLINCLLQAQSQVQEQLKPLFVNSKEDVQLVTQNDGLFKVKQFPWLRRVVQQMSLEEKKLVPFTYEYFELLCQVDLDAAIELMRDDHGCLRILRLNVKDHNSLRTKLTGRNFDDGCYYELLQIDGALLQQDQFKQLLKTHPVDVLRYHFQVGKLLQFAQMAVTSDFVKTFAFMVALRDAVAQVTPQLKLKILDVLQEDQLMLLAASREAGVPKQEGVIGSLIENDYESIQEHVKSSTEKMNLVAWKILQRIGCPDKLFQRVLTFALGSQQCHPLFQKMKVWRTVLSYDQKILVKALQKAEKNDAFVSNLLLIPCQVLTVKNVKKLQAIVLSLSSFLVLLIPLIVKLDNVVPFQKSEQLVTLFEELLNDKKFDEATQLVPVVLRSGVDIKSLLSSVKDERLLVALVGTQYDDFAYTSIRNIGDCCGKGLVNAYRQSGSKKDQLQKYFDSTLLGYYLKSHLIVDDISKIVCLISQSSSQYLVEIMQAVGSKLELLEAFSQAEVLPVDKWVECFTILVEMQTCKIDINMLIRKLGSNHVYLPLLQSLVVVRKSQMSFDNCASILQLTSNIVTTKQKQIVCLMNIYCHLAYLKDYTKSLLPWLIVQLKPVVDFLRSHQSDQVAYQISRLIDNLVSNRHAIKSLKKHAIPLMQYYCRVQTSKRMLKSSLESAFLKLLSVMEDLEKQITIAHIDFNSKAIFKSLCEKQKQQYLAVQL